MEINFQAPPTVCRFMQSKSFIRLIAGPVGSGKTTGCIFELLKWACEQPPAEDGYRYTRFVIVRSTLKQIRDTLLPDITQTWLAPISDYRVSEQKIYWHFGDVRSEILLLPLETPEDQRRLLSLQLSGAYMSECIEMPADLIAPLTGRLGRYPSGNLGVCKRPGLIMDTNMPSEMSPWAKLMQDPPPGFEVFIQPSGLAEDAENLEWLLQTDETRKLSLDIPEELEARRKQGRTYYERFVAMNPEPWVKRYVRAEYGPDPSGTAVFGASFSVATHVVDELEPVPGRMLVIGQDFGRSPCGIITQVNNKGQLLVLEEIMADDIGLAQHIKSNLRPTLMQDRYIGMQAIIIGDPAGAAKSTLFEVSEFDILRQEGFAAMKAVTNDIERRIGAVEKFLLGSVYGEPLFLIDRNRCPQLVQALAGEYRYGYNKAGQRKPTPDKNDASHISDALQYACLASETNTHSYIQGRVLRKPNRPRRERFSSLAWT